MPSMSERTRRKVIRSSETYLNFSPWIYPECQARQILIPFLNYLEPEKKKQKEEPVRATPAANDFSTKRPTSSTYGKKPYHKAETSETQKPSKTGRPLDKNILKALNQMVQEPVVHMQRRDMPLPSGTITIALTGGGK